jgi:hypothetical protein
MKTIFALCVLVALLTQTAAAPDTAGKTKPAASATSPAQGVPATRPAGAAKGGELAALERKLLGAWQGPDCGGDFTFNSDGTFVVDHYSPGQNTFTGTWSVRWDALPPTLLLTFKTSDFKKRDPAVPEYQYVGKTLEAKLLELSSDVLAFRVPNTEWSWRSLSRAE